MEEPNFSAFPGREAALRKISEGPVSSHPDELRAETEAEDLVFAGVTEHIYQEAPYFSKEGQLRMRIENEDGTIIYDNSMEEYEALTRRNGAHLSLELIQQYTQVAKESAGQ